MSQNSHEILKVEKGNTIVVFVLMYGIALQHYVAARVSLMTGLVEPGCLLAHQCVEVFIKAITRLEPQADQPWGHDLNSLLKEANIIVPKFSELIANEGLRIFLDNLDNVYKWKRYGEAKSTMNSSEVVKILDELVNKLRVIHAETIKGSVSKLYVPEELKAIFLKENSVFDDSKITSHPLASFAIPGVSDFNQM